MKELILGGVRSGKSRFAEARARASGLEVIYLATARPGDDEMRARINAHRLQRPSSWITVEEPLELAAMLRIHASDEHFLLIDCLTLWLTNLLCHAQPSRLVEETQALLEVLPSLSGKIVFVSNETNLGIVAADPLTRRFCDEAGVLHQRLASLCDRVVLMIAGLPQLLKGAPI